jgi:nitrate/nitrite transport system substrate-binding protein
MSNKSLGNPYDSNVSLIHTKGCGCSTCQADTDPKRYSLALEKSAEQAAPITTNNTDLNSTDDYMDRAIENAIVRAVFNQDDAGRRRFLQAIGGGTLAAALSSVIPLGAIKAAAK